MASKEDKLMDFLTGVIGMDVDEIEEEQQRLLDDDEVLLPSTALEEIKYNNLLQPQEEHDVDGLFLGEEARTNSDGDITGYVTWLFNEDSNEVDRVNSDNPLTGNTQPKQLEKVTVTDVELMENLETGYTWSQATTNTSVDRSEDLGIETVFDYAQTTTDVYEDMAYLVLARVVEAQTIGDFHPETDKYLGPKPVIEDDSTANLKLVLEDPMTMDQATIKIKDPHDLADLMGVGFDRLLTVSSKKEAQAFVREVDSVLAETDVVVFGRVSLCVNDENVTDGDGNERPWMTMAGFECGFIKSATELEELLEEREANNVQESPEQATTTND